MSRPPYFGARLRVVQTSRCNFFDGIGLLVVVRARHAVPLLKMSDSNLSEGALV
jgi:hypothetical protein